MKIPFFIHSNMFYVEIHERTSVLFKGNSFNKSIFEQLPAKIDHLISIMEHVKSIGASLQMSTWYDFKDPVYIIPKETISSWHECGTPACFAGWCALDSEIRTLHSGNEYPSELLTKYLLGDDPFAYEDTKEYVAEFVDAISLFGHESQDVYDVEIEDITIENVIEKLNVFKQHVQWIIENYEFVD